MSHTAPTSDPAVTVSTDDDGIVTVRIDDGKANALTHGILTAIDETLDAIEAEARVVAVLGRPGRWSAGFDLSVMTAGPEPARDLLVHGAHMALRCFDYPHPIVAGCSGHAVAMGAIWLLALDRRIGVDGAFRIGMNEVRIGMPVPRFAVGLGQFRLSPRHVGDAVQLATLYSPTAAVEAGYLDRVVPPDQLEDAVRAEARDLLELHDTPFALTRANLRGPTSAALRAGLEADLSAFRVAD